MIGLLVDYHQYFEAIYARISIELLSERIKMVAFKTGLCSAMATALKVDHPLKSYWDLMVHCHLLDGAFSRRTSPATSTTSMLDKIAALFII